MYRGLLNQKNQTKEISKLDYQTSEHKDGKMSLGFTSVVSFETPTGVKQFQSPQMESSKPNAQERAAEQAWKWLDQRKLTQMTEALYWVSAIIIVPCSSYSLGAPVAAQNSAGSTQIPGYGVFPRQLQSPPKREASSLPQANVTNGRMYNICTHILSMHLLSQSSPDILVSIYGHACTLFSVHYMLQYKHAELDTPSPCFVSLVRLY